MAETAAARFLWHAGALGITGELELRGRRNGRRRKVLLGVIRRYGVGHPDGGAGWTANVILAVGCYFRLETAGERTAS